MSHNIKRQATIIDSLRRLVSFTSSNDFCNTTYDAAKVRFDQVIALWDEYQTVQSEIDDTCGDKELHNQLTIRAQVEEYYYVSHARLARFVRELNDFQNTANEASTSQSQANSSDIKLPRIILQPFSGVYQDWTSFHDLYCSLIHDKNSITKAQKLHYLKTNLTGEAANLLKSFQATDANYDEAWKLLNSRYNNKRFIVDSYLKTLFGLPTLSTESATGLRRIYDTSLESVRALLALGLPINQWDTILVYIIVNKLDSETHRQWELSLVRDKLPTFKELTQFLESRWQSLEMILSQKPKSQTHSTKRTTNEPTATKSFHLSSKKSCSFCSSDHPTFKCPDFQKQSCEQRTEYVKQRNLCINCLKPGHYSTTCVFGSCRICNKKHHSSLHRYSNASQSTVSTSDKPSTSTSSPQPSEANMFLPSVSSHYGNNNQAASETLLATALVKIQSSFGTFEDARALIDSGSQSTFISESMVQRLKLHKKSVNIPVQGLCRSNAGFANGLVTFTLASSTNKTFLMNISALVLSKVTHSLPSTKIIVNTSWHHLNYITLADPIYYNPNPIDLLIGADVYADMLLEGLIKGPEGSPLAQNTKLGWILFGSIISPKYETFSHLSVVNLHTYLDSEDQLRKFWEIEEINNGKPLLTVEETQCENHFYKTYTRNSDGRYIVKLPFNNSNINLGNSKDKALNRFFQVERRLSKNANLKQQYVSFMQEYISLGHMKLDSGFKTIHNESSYYLPHHCVIKEASTTTKLRVVFDGSCKTSSDVSLNQKLFIGPRLQEDLSSILLRFRKYKYAYTADITKMYRQILVDEEDTNYQKIFWRESPTNPLQIYNLCTVTYGTSAAPYLAVKCLQQLATDDGSNYPLASKAVMTDFYVDDLLSGSHTEQVALQVQKELVELLKLGGFDLRKWSSNCLSILKALCIKDQQPLEINLDNSVKTLGLLWNPIDDNFQFKVNLRPLDKIPTKRMFLSDVASIFDPLGWLAPTIIIAKIMFQELWMSGISWDDQLPTSISAKWCELRKSLKTLENIRIDRWLTTTPFYELELHGFSDASESAYSAVVYARVSGHNIFNVNLITAKTKVAPLKQISLPRLELCGALLLSKLLDSVKNSLFETNVECYAWTDSTIVLAWIKASPNRWKTFVANRISKIQSLTEPSIWHHVSSSDNPADCASRGISSSQLLDHNLWWHGPDWLRETQNKWPEGLHHDITTNIDEKRKVTVLTCITDNLNLELLERFSSISKLKRVTAYLFRFFNNSRVSLEKRKLEPLSATELQASLMFWIKIVQTSAFGPEIACVKAGKNLPPKSKLQSLNPFLDSSMVLRVGGRLQSSNLTYNQIHQIILPYKNKLTNLIVSEAHLSNLHGGPQLLLAFLRRKYWIPSARKLLRQHTHQCVICFRHKGATMQQIMGELPRNRLLPSRPFLKSGVDYAGPLAIRLNKGRGGKTTKGYIAVFVCMTTRAMHLELVSDMTTPGFLAAFKRFVARRGKCADIFSDNGTNFVGAKREMSEVRRMLASKDELNTITTNLANDGTNWHFIPPAAPNFGGLWEAGVKSVKYHLHRILGSTALTFEEMYTVLTQIEACLNSRPLYPLTDDPSDLEILTPGHFLMGEPPTVLPEVDLTQVQTNRLTRWQLVQKLSQHFWNRWSSEFLSRLQQRPKWADKQHYNAKVGDLVLIKLDDRIPPAKWPLGRIVELHPGKDGVSRVATLKCVGGILQRPMNKLCLLPINEE